MGAGFYVKLVMVLVITWAGSCHGHGRLVDPPSRASAWRYGFDTPRDYNDNEGFCGGFNHQYQSQGGRCGICGDAWDENPRPHEAGGTYATGTIVRRYDQGQVIVVRVQITANHRGHFEFRICPNNNPSVEASQTCLNDHPLYKADGSGFNHYIDSGNGIHEVSLKLPNDLTCTQCVFQWRYVAANRWDICEDGTGQLGCGPQEEFRACADVAIDQSTMTYSGQDTTTTLKSGGEGTSTLSQTISHMMPTTTTTTPRPTTTTTTTTSRPTTTTTTTQGGSGGCKATGAWENVPGMNTWCENNCNHVPRYCPSSHCTCA